jgi:peroxiredoxin
VVDVKESKETVSAWAAKSGYTLPILLDEDGKISESFAPPGILPDLPRDQVPIASNLLIDRNGVIRFYSLLDSRNFDAQLVELRKRLDELLSER